MDTDPKYSDQQSKQSRWGFRGKTVWNWMELLIVPLALAVIGLAFSVQQDARQQRVENQRAEAERELAVQRAQDEALQAYLDQMSMLMLEKDLRNSEEDSEVRTLARARTLSVLGRVDTSHKDEIMQFLVESGLVREESYFREGAPVTRGPVIWLSRANLGEIDLRRADLSGAYLDEADLSGASLRSTSLIRADLFSANLSGADLPKAHLFSADLIDANLSGADLSGADLFSANLSGADLSGADLSGTDLRTAGMSEANLSHAKGVTNDQLSAARSLKGATMPDGQKYEDWLKDREDRKQDAKKD